MLLAATQGASAATETPEGIGIQATGTLLTVAPTPVADLATPAPASVATVNAGLVTATAVTAHINGNRTTAGVASLTALAGTGISAGALSSTCTANANGSFTEASNTATVAVLGVTIPVNPAPNTTVTIPLVGSIILNQQIAGPVAGSVTVNALVINATILGETVTVASSTCGPYVAGAPIAGGKGLALGGGVVAAAGAGVVAVKLNRRRRPNGA